MSAEGVVRDWLASLATEANSRVYFAMPEQGTPTLPLMTVARSGGAPDRFGYDTATLRIEVWAVNKGAADALATKVARALSALEDQEVEFSNDKGTIVGGDATAVTPGPGAKLGGTVPAKRYAVFGWIEVRLP